MKLPKRLSRTVIYESEWINLYTDRVELPSGKIIEKYHILDYPKLANVILLLNEKDEFCLIKVRRYATGILGWELPAGSIDEGETAEESAHREVMEETGYKAEYLEKVHEFHAANGMSNHTLNIYFGRVKSLDLLPQHSDTDEVESVHWKTKEEIVEMIKKNEIIDGISLLPITLYLSGLYDIR